LVTRRLFKHKYAVCTCTTENLYDAEITWNKQAWEVDEIASKLMSEKERGNIVVEFGIMVKTP
jgi:hypothetical protein